MSDNLTGRIRYREQKRWLRPSLMVLQVEYGYTAAENCGGFIDAWPAKAWRDAKVTDLTDPNVLAAAQIVGGKS